MNETEESVLYSQMLEAYKNQFGADVIGFLYCAGPGAEVRHVVADSKMKLPIEKIDLWVAPFFGSGDTRNLGAHEDSIQGLTHFVTSPTGGLKHSLILPVTNGNGRPWRSLVWMGYDAYAPGRSEFERAKHFTKRLKNDLENLHRIRDLSEKARSAESQSQAKSDFIAHVSHDIRSPLNNVRSILALFEEEAGSSELAGLLQTARANCDSIGDLVEDILDFSRHQAGHLRPVPERVEISALVDSVVSCFKFAARNKGLVVSFENLLSGAAHAMVDRRHLKRIVSNIFSNAVKYTDHGSIQVQLLGVAPHWKIRIIDTGEGMSPEQIGRLFTPFTRLTDKAEGIGLGLAVTRILAQANGIQIGVGSRLGEGSTFEVVVPGANSDEFALLESATGAQHFERKVKSMELQPNLFSQFCVLLVDDDRDCTDTLAKNLRRHGFRVVTSNAVQDALDKLEVERPNVVISDYDMPNGGGSKIVSEARRLSDSVSLLLLTGRDDPKIAADIKGLGANEVMVKPAEVSDIINWIERQLGAPWLLQDELARKAG
jgi:signal transduction histidine kinase/ActR/RegA family two-component response regulator